MDRQMDRQIDRWIDKCIDKIRQMDRRKDRQILIQIYVYSTQNCSHKMLPLKTVHYLLERTKLHQQHYIVITNFDEVMNVNIFVICNTNCRNLRIFLDNFWFFRVLKQSLLFFLVRNMESSIFVLRNDTFVNTHFFGK